MTRDTTKLNFFAACLLFSLVKADWEGQGPWGGGDGDWNGNGNPWWGGNDSSNDDNNDDNSGDTANSTNGFGLGSVQSFDRASRVLIAHAVIASLVWVMFIPSGAILLRLGLKSPIVLKLHAALQVLSYFLYIVAAGLGIWLAQQTAQFGTWSDPHPRLGLAILAIAFFQPIFGIVHHRIFKKRSAALAAGKPTTPPGRTIPGHMHLWVGRSLIVLGMINGGLGIRLASFSPFQTDDTTRKLKIVYGIVAAGMFALYATLVIVFEVRRKRAQRILTVSVNASGDGARSTAQAEQAAKLPTYQESEESLQSQRNDVSRYH